MKILLANKNIWWKSGGTNQPGFKDKAAMLAAIDADYFDGKTTENLAGIKPVTPVAWTASGITASIDKSALMKTRSGTLLTDLLQVNYAVVDSGKGPEFYFVDSIQLQADKITVILTKDVWVNVMSWRDKLDHEVYVEREHADRFLIENGVPTGFDFSEGSVLHNYEDMQGLRAEQLLKKTPVNPFRLKLSGHAEPSDPKFHVNRFYINGTDDPNELDKAGFISEIKSHTGYDLTLVRLNVLLERLAELNMGRQKFLRAYVEASKTSGENSYGWATHVAGMADLPMGVLVAPAATAEGAQHALDMNNGGAMELHSAYATDPLTLGFQVATYPEYGLLEFYKSEFAADKITFTYDLFLRGHFDEFVSLAKGKMNGEEFYDLISDRIIFSYENNFLRVNQKAQAQNIATVPVNSVLVHPFDDEFIGVPNVVTAASFEPKLNIAPFASYNIGTSFNEGGVIEPNKFYGELNVGFRSITSLSPESTAQRLYIGSVLSAAGVETLINSIGAYKNTDQTSLGGHWSNPFYPPTVDDKWKDYVAGHKSSVISGALVQGGSDIGKFGMALGAGALAGGPVGALIGAGSALGAGIAGEIGFWSHRSDIQKSPQKITGGGAEWSIAANMDLSTYIKTHGMLKSDEDIVLKHLNSNGYLIGRLKIVNFKSRTRYNFIKIKDAVSPEFFSEEYSAGIIDSVSEMLQAGVRIWHYGAAGNILNYGTENWEISVAKGAK